MYLSSATKEKLYNDSNSVINVCFKAIKKSEFENLMSATEDLKDRQAKAQHFCNYLCSVAKIPPLEVRVVNKPQPSTNDNMGRTRSKVLGTYTQGREVITMYNLTAKQQKVVAIKTFVGTLLHEFMHHYDIYYLNLPTSYHTKGFYMRLSDLQNKCKKVG